MAITVIPAIDVIGGKCVRLTRGNYDECTVYYDDPVEAALRFEGMGMERLHLVDLDGAKASRVVNFRVLERICRATGLKVDFSGGVKSEEDIRRVLDAGAKFVCIGSMAQKDRERTAGWLDQFGAERVIIGADVKGERVCINGWKVETGTTIHELIEAYLPVLKHVMCTDIARDGMMGGVSLELYRKLVSRYPGISFIASGGVRSWEDIRALEDLGISSVIVGKAFYEKGLEFKV